MAVTPALLAAGINHLKLDVASGFPSFADIAHANVQHAFLGRPEVLCMGCSKLESLDGQVKTRFWKLISCAKSLVDIL